MGAAAEVLEPEDFAWSEDELAQLRRMRGARISLARTSGADFNAYVLRDEETGRPVENAPYHDEWHDLIEATPRLGIWAHIESAKTQQLSIGRILYEIGLNPNIRIAIVSSVDGQAVKILRAIRGYIERSAELREVFPHLRPGPLWTDKQIIVQRSSNAKDPTIQVCGSKGKIVGSRLDLVILDDILNVENTGSKAQRDKLRAWYLANIAGRVVRRSRIVFVSTAWDPDDLMHWLAARRGWRTARYPVVNDNGVPLWPERWPLERINRQIDDFGGLGSTECNRQLFVRAVDESTRRFPEELLTKALGLGDGYEFVNEIPPAAFKPGGELDGAVVVCGVDLAAKRKKKFVVGVTPATVFVTSVFYKNGTRQLLNVESGSWTSPEIAEKLIDVHRRYGAVIYVETNGVQRYILEMLELYPDARDIPVRTFFTGVNKWDPILGVESIVAELHKGRWIFPSEEGKAETEEMKALLAEMRNFTGDPNAHTGDRLMAFWICVLGGRAGGGEVTMSAKVIRARSPQIRRLRGEGEEDGDLERLPAEEPAPEDDAEPGREDDEGPLIRYG